MSKLNFTAIKSNRFRFVCFPILLLVVGFVFAAQLSRVNSENLNPIQSQNQEINISKQAKKQYTFLEQPQIPESHTLVGSFYSLKNNLTATLMLNNKGGLPLDITPTFYSSGGTRLQLAPINVREASYAEFDLREMLANAGAEFQEGSLQMTYLGKKMQLGSQVKLIDTADSLIWEEQFVEPAAKYVSSQLEAVWWMPSNNCDTKFIISNTTDAPVTATITIDGTSPGQQTPAAIQLNAHETRVLDVIRDLVGKNNGTIHTTGGVSISHTGTAGAILARMLVSKASKGFSSTMNFIDPQMTASSKWHGAGLHLGKVNNQKLEQILVARNVGGETTVVRGKIPYTNNNGEVVSINIPPTTIAPNSVKTINLQSSIDAANVPANVKDAGLEMSYTTSPGSVVMSAVSVSPDNNQVFQVPLYDPQKTPPSAGGYPWKADGDFTTVVYIKNDTDQPQKYVASLHYEGGGYSLGVKEIKPHQLTAIDFRQLRDNQTPDVNGKIIPFNIERGQIAWSGKYTPSGALNGRSSQLSLSQGISSTYDCRNFCRDSYYDGYLIYDLPLQYVYDVANFEAYQQDMNGYGFLLTPYSVSANWQSTNGTIASIYGTGEATALAEGTTIIQGNWLAERFIGEVGNSECNFESFNALAEEFIDVQPPCPYPTNFQQVGNGMDIGEGRLRFNYSYGSSTGNTADLSQCSIGEIVTYPGTGNYFPPSPPFPTGGFRNPVIIDFPATSGSFIDTHMTPGAFVTPYSSSSFTATQYYRYKCPCRNNGDYVNLVGPISIVRSVSPSTGGQWKFTVTKSGASATINPLP